MTTAKPKAQARCYMSDTVVLKGQSSQSPADDGVVWGTVLRCWHDVDPPVDELTVKLCPDLRPGQVFVYWRCAYTPAAVALIMERSTVLPDTPTERLSDGSRSTLLAVVEDSELVVDSRMCDTGLHAKRNVSDAMSGTIESIDTQLSLRHLVTGERRVVPSAEVFKSREWYLDAIVRCGNWIGIIDEIKEDALIMLEDGTIRTCPTLDLFKDMGTAWSIKNQLHAWDTTTPGCSAVLEKTGYEPGKLIRAGGAEQVNDEASLWEEVEGLGSFRKCRLLSLETTSITVTWQYHRVMSSPNVSEKPPEHIPQHGSHGRVTLKEIQVFQTCMDGHAYDVGESVAFKNAPWRDYADFVETCTDIDSAIDPLSLVQEWRVERVQQQVTLRWQDGTHSTHASTDIVKYDYIDELDLWPADPVEHKQTGKVGVVQKVSPVDRIAHVRWYADTKIEEQAEELSLYDLVPIADLEIDDRDYVLIMEDGDTTTFPQVVHHSDKSPPVPAGNRLAHQLRSAGSMLATFVLGGVQSGRGPSSTSIDTSPVEWFGQVVRLEPDGNVLVSLGLASPVQTIRIDPDRLLRVVIGLPAGDGEYDDMDLDSESGSYMSVDQEGDLADAEDLPWKDESGEVVSEGGSAWEDDDEDITDEPASIPLDVGVSTEPAAVPATVNGAPADEVTPTTLSTQRHDRSTEVHPAARPVQLQSDSMPSDPDHFAAFEILETEPADHWFREERAPTEGSGNLKRIQKEYGILRNSLPPGILVRTFENRLDLLRILIVGPPGTPYEYAPMVFDVHLPHNFGRRPPNVYFHSWTNGVGRVNPNLYEDGKVCLSLLGTWEGNEQTEIWTPKSTLLQVFVSIQSLILVKEPYYNEAGFEVLTASDDNAVASRNYSERAYVLTRDFVAHALEDPPAALEHELRWLYIGPGNLLTRVIARATAAMQEPVNAGDTANGKAKPSEDEYRIGISRGAQLLLRRTIAKLHTIAAVNAPHPPAA